MKNIKRILLGLTLLVVLAMTACGAHTSEEYEMKYAVEETAAAMDYPAMEEAAYDSGYAMNSAAGVDGQIQVQPAGRKLIKTVYIDLETKDYDGLVANLKDQISAVGGYIENSSSSSPSAYNTYGGSRNMSLTIRIPSDKLDAFVNDVENVGNVTYKSENVQDITLQYTDTESRKNSLLTEQDRLNQLMKQAETVEDLIAIESRLSEVRYELESIESQLRTYDNQVDYSTVTVSINEVVQYTPQKEDTFWERVKDGFVRCIEGIGEFFEDLGYILLAGSPVILLLAIVAVIVVIIIKAIKKKRNKKKEEQGDGIQTVL